MKGKANFFTSLLLFAAGVALIVMHNDVNILEVIVTFLGIVFIVPGVINIAISAFSRKAEKEASKGRDHKAAYVVGLATSVFGIALGIAMLMAPHFFAGVIAYLFAALLIAAGVYHILASSYLARPFVLPFYFYIIPVLMIIAGLVILFTSVRTLDKIVVLMTGIAMIASAICSLMEYMGTHPARHEIVDIPRDEALPEKSDEA